VTTKLRVDGVTKTYGTVGALKGVSLEMHEGEFLTLLGPSGSGKTTLLMILAGLLDPSEGEITIDGKRGTHLPSFRRDIGMVFQNYALFPHLSIYENIAFPLRMRRMPDADIARRVAEVLDAVQLPEVAQRLPRELSGGQQQRIALARCIVYRPSIILMDEPLGALDKKLRDQLQLEIKRLHDELGVTILYVTHDQDEAMVMSDRVCLMNGGRIEQIGPPDELYFHPVSVFAATFLGESNLFEGRVLRVDASASSAEIDIGGGHTMRAALRGALQPGQPVTCMVRPESMRLLADSASADNVLAAKIDTRIMVGGITRSYVELATGTRALAVMLTNRGDRALARGDVVRCGWSAADTVIIADAASRP
jgi:putative spermidine/putrescine transport system ATP-binding protein